MRFLVAIAVFVLATCADFADAELEYCAEHPGVCPTRFDAGTADAGTDGGP